MSEIRCMSSIVLIIYRKTFYSTHNISSVSGVTLLYTFLAKSTISISNLIKLKCVKYLQSVRTLPGKLKIDKN